MKYAKLALVIFAIFGKGDSQSTFDQIVAHNHLAMGTFEQRYWQRTFGPYPPTVGFLMISGESEDYYPLRGAWMKYAQQLSDEGIGIVCFELEHRYYGKSQPPPSKYMFLNSNQALDDIEYFLNRKSSEFSNKLKWVVFGGSYAGSLAAWARQTYPDLIHAAVASSAPLEAKADLSQYFEIVRESLASVSPSCPSILTQLVTQRRVTSLIDLIPVYVQNGLQDQACKIVNCVASSPSFDIRPCLAFYGSSFKRMLNYRKFHHGVLVAGRGFQGSPWVQQVCMEFGWFQTSETDSSLFGRLLPLRGYVEKTCNGDYDNLNRGIEGINAQHHGKNFSTERVLFMHGSLDPWIVAGVTSPRPNMPVHIIEGGSHCKDMELLQGDSEMARKVAEAQNIAMHYLRQWLQ